MAFLLHFDTFCPVLLPPAVLRVIVHGAIVRHRSLVMIEMIDFPEEIVHHFLVNLR